MLSMLIQFFLAATICKLNTKWKILKGFVTNFNDTFANKMVNYHNLEMQNDYLK
jgi:hypothetical protein